MTRFARYLPWVTFALAAALCAGCHKNQAAEASNSGSVAQNPTADPADANLAPVPDNEAGSATPVSSEQAQSPAYDESSAEDADYSEQPAEYAPQPPPPLPDYQQPPCPGDNYIWTPGYWAYSTSGYYWVPGAWVAPPYEGALWTPGYWGSSGGRYAFYPGHWGSHIGFYGGINYGFGYAGLGYEGGYWNGGHFYYNRAVNNVAVDKVHNIYSHPVAQGRDTTRISFNGGSRGVQVRPRPAEKAAWREPSAPRMSTQVSHAQSFRSDRGQQVAYNHGRPANPVTRQPIQADRNVRPTVPQARPQPVERQYGSGPGRNEVRGRPAPRQQPAGHGAKPENTHPQQQHNSDHRN